MAIGAAKFWTIRIDDSRTIRIDNASYEIRIDHKPGPGLKGLATGGPKGL